MRLLPQVTHCQVALALRKEEAKESSSFRAGVGAGEHRHRQDCCDRSNQIWGWLSCCWYEVKTGSCNLFKELEAIAAVTPADIQQVAQRTFAAQNRTVGVCCRRDEEMGDEEQG